MSMEWVIRDLDWNDLGDCSLEAAATCVHGPLDLGWSGQGDLERSYDSGLHLQRIAVQLGQKREASHD